MDKEVTVRVEKDRLVFGENISFPAERVFVDHPDDSHASVESFDPDRFPWITLWLYRVESGVLVCDVSNFKSGRRVFGSLPSDLFGIREVLLFHDNPKVSELANIRLKPKPIPRFAPRPKPVSRSRPSVPPPPPREFSEQIAFSVPLEHFRFVDGGVELDWNVRLSQLSGQSRVQIHIDNSFFSPKLNCIKPYLSKALEGRRIEVKAVARVKGGNVSVANAQAPQLDRITHELLGQVRYNIVKGELKKGGGLGGRITTAQQFFDKVADAGFAESDKDFIADLVRAKNTKHADHIEYLAKRHDPSQVRLRLVREPFSFLFFIPAESGCWFVWETLDGTDATYLWKIGPPSSCSGKNREKLKGRLAGIERILDRIHAAGRNEYLREEHGGFFRIFHDYDEGGFEKWKQAIDWLLAEGRLEPRDE